MSFVAAAVYSGRQARKGAKAQQDALRDSNDTQWAMYEQTRQDNMPWLDAGSASLNALMQLQGFQNIGGRWTRAGAPANLQTTQLQMDPGYLFRLGQGQDAVQNSMAARGGALSGNALKALNEYGQNFASNEYGNVYNRLAGLANTGQATAQNLGSFGQNTANTVGNNLAMIGQARASGYAGQANAVNGMIDNGIEIFGIAAGMGRGNK